MPDMVYIDSEIGKLKKVILHTPGIEIEAMTPQTAARLLYNDIIPLTVVKREHEVLKRFLNLITQVYEIQDVLREILENPGIKEEFIHTLTGFFSIPGRREELASLTAKELTSTAVCGLPEKKDTLTRFLDAREFDIPPLPNLYFCRDYGMVFRDLVLTGSMANFVRRLEALLCRFIFKHHPDFRNQGLVFDGAMKTNPEITLEGGDFLMADR